LYAITARPRRINLTMNASVLAERVVPQDPEQMDNESFLDFVGFCIREETALV
jgi:hypothetical protein